MADKQILAEYVHDAVEMETRRHTLNRLRDSIIYSRKQRVTQKERDMMMLENQHKQDVKNAEDHLNYLERKHQQYIENKQIQRNNIEKILSEPIKLEPFCFEFLTPLVPIFAIIFPIIIGTPLLFTTNFGTVPITVSLMIIGALFGIITSYPIQKAIWKKNRTNEEKKQEKIKLDYTEQIKSIDQEISEETSKYQKEFKIQKQKIEQLLNRVKNENNTAKEELALAQRTYDELTPHINAMGKQLDTMDSQLHQFYAVNFIPPDYRSLECVIAFDQMFRNDLVDTIRAAVLLYEERVFRGEMVKGIENIRCDLQNLSALMSETVSVLRRIDNNTNRMSDQLYTISSDITRMNANVTGHLSTISGNISSLGSSIDYIADSQSNIASELEYSRYANDAIRANSDRMIWYAEQHRQGLL